MSKQFVRVAVISSDIDLLIQIKRDLDRTFFGTHPLTVVKSGRVMDEDDINIHRKMGNEISLTVETLAEDMGELYSHLRKKYGIDLIVDYKIW